MSSSFHGRIYDDFYDCFGLQHLVGGAFGFLVAVLIMGVDTPKP